MADIDVPFDYFRHIQDTVFLIDQLLKAAEDQRPINWLPRVRLMIEHLAILRGDGELTKFMAPLDLPREKIMAAERSLHDRLAKLKELFGQEGLDEFREYFEKLINR